MNPLEPRPLNATDFTDYGEVIEIEGHDPVMINQGTTERFDRLAPIDVHNHDGKASVSIFRAQPRALPLELAMMERHPLGSQAFMPLSNHPFLVVVGHDAGGKPGRLEAFLTNGVQGVSYARNVWHHPVLALGGVREFVVIDRTGPGSNLEEHYFSGDPVVLKA